MAVARWFIARNKEKVGPFAPTDLKQLAMFGLLKPEEFVLMEGASKWLEAKSVPWLFAPTGQKKFTLKLLGQARGPYLIEQIEAALTTREITLDTLAQENESKPWTPLRQLEEFRDFGAKPISPSRAELFTNTLEIEEAAMHMAGKSGDVLARLISKLLDMQRTYADNPALAENIETTLKSLRTRRDELARSAKEAPVRPGTGLK